MKTDTKQTISLQVNINDLSTATDQQFAEAVQQAVRQWKNALDADDIEALLEQSFDNLEQQKLHFRTQLRAALAQDGGLQGGDFGPEVDALVNMWIADPRSLLDAEAIEFIVDDETLS